MLPTLDLKSQINSLVKLQTVDTEIYSLKSEKEAKPIQIKGLSDSFEQKKQSLADLEKKVLDLQKQIKEQDLEIATKKEATAKLKTQLYS